MKRRDRGLERWAMERRQEKQAKNTHSAFTSGLKGAEPEPGWGGIEIHSSDTEQGARDFEVALRPVLLGLVEWHVKLSTQGVDAAKPHSKIAWVYTTPQAARELAAQLLETAAEAEKGRIKPRPVK